MIRRGDLFYADLSPVTGSEQGGERPVVILQNDTGNIHSPTVIVAAITAKTSKCKLPTHVEITSHADNLDRDSVVLTEQIRTIDKCRLKEKIGSLDVKQMQQVDYALKISLGLIPCHACKTKETQ